MNTIIDIAAAFAWLLATMRKAMPKAAAPRACRAAAA